MADFREGLIGDVERARVDHTSAQEQLFVAQGRVEQTRKSIVSVAAMSRERLYDDIADQTGVIQGERVLDFLEGSFRINETPRGNAKTNAEEIGSLLFGKRKKPTAVMLGYGNGIFAINPNTDDKSAPRFTVERVTDRGRIRGYYLFVESEDFGILTSQANADYSQENKNKFGWVLRNRTYGFPLENQNGLEINGQDGSILTDNLIVGRLGQVLVSPGNNGSSRYVEYSTQHAVAIVAHVRTLRGLAPGNYHYANEPHIVEPTMLDKDSRQIFAKQSDFVEDNLSNYMRQLMQSETSASPEIPLIFHPAMLEYLGVSREGLLHAVASAVCRPDRLRGGIVEMKDIDRIAARLAEGKSPNIGQILTTSITRQAKLLIKQAGRAGVADLLGLTDPHEILDAGKGDPHLFVAAGRPNLGFGERIDMPDDKKVELDRVEDALSDYTAQRQVPTAA